MEGIMYFGQNQAMEYLIVEQKVQEETVPILTA